MSAKLTEETLANVFNDIVNSEDWLEQLPSLPNMMREMECQQGRPDFVASPAVVGNSDPVQRALLSATLTTPSLTRILSVLKRAAPRTEQYIGRSLGLPLPAVRRGLATLEHNGIIVRRGVNGYVRSSVFMENEIELWAFEIKLSDWQRALYQALQYQSFAHRVTVVMADQWVHRAEKNIDTFKRLDVGVMALNEGTAHWRWIHKPQSRTPRSNFHYLYALGKFLRA